MGTSVKDFMLHKLTKLKDNRNSFNLIFKGFKLENYWDHISGFDIVKLLNNGGTLDEAKEMIYEQSHSGMSYGLVCSMVREFCDRGNEFVEYVKI